tara:strand:- start:178 stop:1359 length:1182 start_codon:yes stop_codon:yes gene_type:complete
MKSSERITIIFILNHFYPYYSGAGKNAKNLITKLIKLGHDVIVITPSYDRKKEKDIIDDVKVIRIKIYPYFSHFTYHLFIFLNLLILKIKGLCVVQLYGLKQRGYIGAILFSKLFNKKIIGRISLLGSDDLYSIKNYSGRLGLVRYFCCQQYDSIICTSDKIYIETIKEVNSNKAKLISQFVDTKRFRPLGEKDKLRIRTKNKVNNKLVFLFCGLPIYRKGFDTIIGVWPSILNSIPNSLLIVVGPFDYHSADDRDFPKKEFERMINDKSIKKSIKLVGETKTPELYYQMADIFIFPSRKEGFPNALLEAMSSGLPAIVGDYKWVRNNKTIKDMHNIIISKTEDLYDIVSKANLLNDKNLIRSIGSHARDSMIKHHEVKEKAIEYSNFLNELV